ncbi:MAG TPA: ABC transporter substrate-binding protein, partial [Chloroflexota bacterium]
MALATLLRQVPLFGACVCLLAVSCAPGASPVARTGEAVTNPPSQPKVLNIGVSTELPQLGVLASESTGGWTDLTELHTSSLTTPDTASSKSIGRLAEKVPSIDDASISLLADGKMRVVYHLRPNVTWQDGAPFSAQDLVFSHRFLLDPGLPVYQRDTVRLIESVEAPDDLTAVFTFAHPFFRGADLSARDFWPHPRHLLEIAFNRYRATANADEMISLPYWTSSYVNLGPFRVTAFDPGEGVTFQAYPGFFLGRPKVDTIHVRPFRDENALFANLLAGSIDLFPELALHPELAAELKGRWEQSGDGAVRPLAGTSSFLVPQWRPSVITEPANLDVRVRQALYHA